MAQFCTACGAQIATGAKFCNACGAMQQASAGPAAAAAPAPAPVAAAPAPATGGGFLKVVLIVVGVMVLLGGIGLVGVVYTGYRVAKTVKTAAREKGVDLDALTESNPVSGRLPDPCSLLSTNEASDILGVKVVSSERSANTCTYRTETMSAEDQQEKIAKAMKDLEAKGADTEKDPTKALEAVTKAFGGSMAGGNGGFSIELNPDGKQALAAMRLAMRMAGGKELSKKISDVGDDAEMGPLGSMLVFTKRGLGVQLDGRMITGQDKLVAMAQKIASRI